MTDKSMAEEWAIRSERGTLPALKLGVWIALRLGRPVARMFLYPTCLYFLASSRAAARSSRQYLARVLGRKPTIAEIFRHYLTFASCVLDRVFLLNEQIDQFDIRVQGEEVLHDTLQRGKGCMLFGAHFGSFEVTRAVGRQQRNLQIGVVMYEENAHKIRSALAAINPQLETEVIALGQLHSLITVAERLNRGHFIGMLVDRNVDGEDRVRLPFFGSPAMFPQGPFRMAMLLRRPVVMMVGTYCGGKTYEIHFERLMDPSEILSNDVNKSVDMAMRRYVAQLERFCRAAPFNWFNFYDFWN